MQSSSADRLIGAPSLFPITLLLVSQSRWPFIKHSDDRRARARARAVPRVRDRAADCVGSCIPDWAVSQPIADQIKAVPVHARTDLVEVPGGGGGHVHPVVCSPKNLSDGLEQPKAVLFGMRGFHSVKPTGKARADRRKISACARPAPRVINNVSLVSGFSIIHNPLISFHCFGLL